MAGHETSFIRRAYTRGGKHTIHSLNTSFTTIALQMIEFRSCRILHSRAVVTCKPAGMLTNRSVLQNLCPSSI